MLGCKELQGVLEAFDSEDSTQEQRGALRRPYHRLHRIAPFLGEGGPLPTDFQSALCNDISANGMSFFWPQVPSFKSVMIRLGDADKQRDVIANVLWRARSPVAAGYLIGCQFVRLANA
jgi:hypothetical protein